MAIALAATLAGAIVALPDSPAIAQVTDLITPAVKPPALPDEYQPPIPAPDTLWVPGFWAWDGDENDYYWVGGSWITPPGPDLLWTPGYWARSDAVYIFYVGYWGSRVGYYGGIDYGHGYTAGGYYGGFWRDHHVVYNRAATNLGNNVMIRTYFEPIAHRGKRNPASFNGPDGARERATRSDLVFARQEHIDPTARQAKRQRAARGDPLQYARNNDGHPELIAALYRQAASEPKRTAPIAASPIMPNGTSPTTRATVAAEHRPPPHRPVRTPPPAMMRLADVTLRSREPIGTSATHRAVDRPGLMVLSGGAWRTVEDRRRPSVYSQGPHRATARVRLAEHRLAPPRRYTRLRELKSRSHGHLRPVR